ncbi:M61 family metallopeptidase [Luteibaculum oceani]|uniref:M61 family metallopeptidase n=1 Tax=Luteibaculum oceani TaxID=1294296 RepID=A0A5C6VAC7_9FLAO|nr:M61 family metallopeptidase [Luteibaculum oceani]TXC81451.1 M61 family metallopeptidase [Luteibaculum oceani]
MIHYKLSYEIPTRHFIHVDFCMENPKADIQLINLPFWRPGRYERGSFAKNIQEFHVFDENKKHLNFRKVEGHTWEIETQGAKELHISYNYYAADLNAGSTYVDRGILYVNPVNLCLYPVGEEATPCTLELKTEEGLKVLGAMPELKDGKYQFSDFHHIADTPFMCVKKSQTIEVKTDRSTYFLHFWGYFKLDETKISRDFKKFITLNEALFSENPYKDYHFLFIGLPNNFHHGVEHKESTVIALGPGHSILGKDYNEFLSISCHELYHAWNVKSIRPIELWPYRYNEDSYSNLGYLCEGVTTYMGNLLLFQSGVWEFEDLAQEFEKFFDRHFNNFGRYNHSVAESSFDTWLDGYERGIPNRKVSIYNEGALLTFCMDTIIRKKHDGKKSFHDVMHKLYEDFYKNGLGVSEQQYWDTIAHFAGEDIRAFFENYIHGTGDYHAIVDEAFDYLGLEYEAKPAKEFHEAHLGMKIVQRKGENPWHIIAIYPGSPAETMGLYVGDQLLMVNDIEAEDDFPKWLEYFVDDKYQFVLRRNSIVKLIELKASERVFYKDYKVKRLDHPSRSQREAYNKWSYKK